MKVTGVSVCPYGAGVMLKQLQAMLVEVNGVQRGQDSEHIHRMRVASRRLRAALPLFSDCFPARKAAAWEESLRKVTSSLGMARDADVQIELMMRFLAGIKDSQQVPGVRRLQLRWKQKREALQAKILKTLDEMQASRVFEKMGAFLLPFTLGIEPNAPPPHALYELADRAIGACLDEFLSYEPFITQPDKITELHQMRIAAKRLRYSLELFAPLYPEGLSNSLSTLRNAQDLLGDIHDCDAWTAIVPQFLDKERQRVIAFYGNPGPWNLLLPGVRAFLEERRLVRSEKYQSFLRKWQLWKEKQIWYDLRQTTAALLIDRSALYPPSPSEPPIDQGSTA